MALWEAIRDLAYWGFSNSQEIPGYAEVGYEVEYRTDCMIVTCDYGSDYHPRRFEIRVTEL